HHARTEPACRLRTWAALLPRRAARAPRGADRSCDALRPLSRPAPGPSGRVAALAKEPDRARPRSAAGRTTACLATVPLQLRRRSSRLERDDAGEVVVEPVEDLEAIVRGRAVLVVHEALLEDAVRKLE